LTLIWKKGKNKEKPRKQKKREENRAEEKLVLGREKVRTRPECGVQVSKLKEATDQQDKTLWIIGSRKYDTVASIVNVLA